VLTLVSGMGSPARSVLIARLRRGRSARRKLVHSQLSRSVAQQVRGIRERLGLSQAKLADAIGSNQNAVYRLESPGYGKATLTTLRRVAAAMDVALIVRFVPYSELVDSMSGTARPSDDRAYVALPASPFEEEETAGVFDRPESTTPVAAAGTETRAHLEGVEEPRRVVEITLWRQKQFERPPRPIL